MDAVFPRWEKDGILGISKQDYLVLARLTYQLMLLQVNLDLNKSLVTKGTYTSMFVGTVSGHVDAVTSNGQRMIQDAVAPLQVRQVCLECC
jgi:hypothetical protein